jgi:ABC-type polysaccharide transport system permease subunit
MENNFWRTISSHGIVLPLCSVKEVMEFAEKIRNEELREILVRMIHFFGHFLNWIIIVYVDVYFFNSSADRILSPPFEDSFSERL